MNTQQFKQVEQIEKPEAELIFSSGNSDQICFALLSSAFYINDWKWVQDKCLSFLSSPDIDVVRIAIICLGHIARINRKIEKEKVLTALRSEALPNETKGTVEDAIDDITMFAK